MIEVGIQDLRYFQDSVKYLGGAREDWTGEHLKVSNF